MNKVKEIEEKLSEREIDRVIEMAWEDRTTFDAIEMQFNLEEKTVIELMRRNLSGSGFRRWRKRVQNRSTKHAAKSADTKGRFKSSRQKHISMNKISKR